VGFGKSIRKSVSRVAKKASPRSLATKARKLAKKAARAAGKGVVAGAKLNFKVASSFGHVVSQKALGGQFDPWTAEGRLQGAMAAGTVAAALATGGLAAAGVAGAGALAPALRGGAGAFAATAGVPAEYDTAPAAVAAPGSNNGPDWTKIALWTAGGFLAWRILRSFT
jgi:hypothetical protein